MHAALEQYLRVRPRIVLSHDAPTHVARSAWQNARRFSAPNPKAAFCASRTTDFLERLLEHHRPRLWLFGHHHRDWRHQEGGTLFVCVGELSYVDIGPAGNVHDRHFTGWHGIPPRRVAPVNSRAEPGGSPNAGPAERSDNSGTTGGPQSGS